MIVDKPELYDQMLTGFTFIYGVDDPNKEVKVPDRYDSYEVAVLIYKNLDKPDKVGRVALDMRE